MVWPPERYPPWRTLVMGIGTFLCIPNHGLGGDLRHHGAGSRDPSGTMVSITPRVIAVDKKRDL